MNIRLAVAMFIFVSAYALAGAKAYELQVAKGDLFLARAETQFGAPQSVRGGIFITDAEGAEIPAAINKTTPVVYAIPAEIADPQEYAALLSQVIGIDYDAAYRALDKEGDPYELLLDRPTEAQVQALRDAPIPGIYVGERQRRTYPLKTLAAHVIGFIAEIEQDSIPRGRYGVEAAYESRLAGAPGRDGAPIHLSIDQHIQAEGERIIRNLVSRYAAHSGMFIVQDPLSGSILAMGATPTFDPNVYGSYPLGSFLNPTVQAVYEPGSIFKVITMAIGIDAGKITPDTTYYDAGEVTLNGRTIKNWDEKAYGVTTMRKVIEHSLNVGAVAAQQKIGRDIFLSKIQEFGFGAPTGIGLPGEVAGSIRTLTGAARDINYATASFGQGISVTPIELINAVSVIANGGMLLRPHIDASVQPEVIRTVISSDAARQTTEMMVSAVDTAKVARIPGYSVAGKTGTAQVPDSERGGYSDDVINTYVGFAPAYNPAFIILIRIDRPEGAPLAGQTVVPAFRELAEFILNYRAVPPDRIRID